MSLMTLERVNASRLAAQRYTTLFTLTNKHVQY